MNFQRAINFIRKPALALLVFLYFIICFRVISRMPLGLINELISLAFVFALITLTFIDQIKVVLNGKLNYLLLILTPLIVYPFINAFVALSVYGQPYHYGILAQRYHYYMLGAFAVVYFLRKKIITVTQAEHYYVVSMYIILSIMYFFYVFINPAIFSGTEFVKLTGYKGWIYELPNEVPAGLLVYAFIRITMHNARRHLITLALTLFFFLVYGQDRSQMAAIGIVLLMFTFFHLKPSKILVYFVSGFMIISLLVTILMITAPDFIGHYTQLFGNAFTIFTGERTEEYSTSIRYVESEIALKGIAENPVLGNGFLSYQWNKGYMQFYKYFYPADIGILGNLFAFGIIGTFFYYLPFLACFKWMYDLRKNRNPFLLTSMYTLMFIFIDMQSAANNIKFIGIQAFYWGVIYYFRFYSSGESDSLSDQAPRITSEFIRPYHQ
jgi:hypothetical protein